MDMQNIENIYTCSPIQEGMLFHTIHQPGSSLYVEQLQFRIHGTLDIKEFENAWNELIQWHSTLRTTFHWKETDQILQIVHKEMNIHVKYMDVHNHHNHYIEELVQDTANDIKNSGFDLSQGPLMKLHLIKLGNQTYQFIWTFHHLLLDGWSMAQVLKDFFNLYGSNVLNKPVNMPSYTQYESYISWLKAQDENKARIFWEKKLSGIENVCPFTKDKKLDRHETVQNNYQDTFISKSVKEQLTVLAKKNETTLFSVLQAAWMLLINCKYNMDDIVVGNVVSGRPSELNGVEEIVGPFINTLPLRVKLNPDDSVLSLIKEIQKEQLDISTYAYTHIKDIHKICKLDTNHALFDSIVVYENYPLNKNMFSDERLGFEISNFQIEEKSNFPLSLAIIPLEEQLLLRLHYDSTVISTNEIKQLLEYYESIIYQINHNVTRTIDSIHIIPQENIPFSSIDDKHNECKEKHQDHLLHEIFELQVKQFHNKIALKLEDHLLTYEQLNERAEQVARLLVTMGLTLEEPVGVLLNRSIESIVSMLGILKAGGVYVPLDTKLPRERMNYIMEDSSIDKVITVEDYVDKLDKETTKIQLDNLPNLSNVNHIDKTQKKEIKNLAYIMYTSGSTGVPKGVGITHEAAVLHCKDFQKQFDITYKDIVLQFSSLTFDPSIEQIFPTLFSGGQIYMRGESIWDTQTIIQIIKREQITVANLPTAYFHEMVNNLMLTKNRVNLDSLRILAIGGDKISSKHIQNWNSMNSGMTELLNFYGPTETVTTSTYYPVHSFEDSNNVPIGYPLSERMLYIVDKYDRMVPPGEKGELCIGGKILSRGYINKRKATAEKFVPDPFHTAEGAVMYRTGDIVRLNKAGILEYFGREDDQVKIRGFRIELGEIEKAFFAIPEVGNVAVLTENTRYDMKQLIAYVVATKRMDVAALRDILKEKLPEYMVPKHIIFMDQLPLNINGKVDRKLLTTINLEKEGEERTEKSIIVPKNEIEKRLVEIWQQVLQKDVVSITDNFFELGGDSIIALQIIAKAQEKGINISTQDLFDKQTIEDLAVKEDTNSYQEVAVTALAKHNVDSTITSIPLTPIQFWFFQQKFLHHNHWNQSVLLKVKERLNIKSLTIAVETVIKQHEALTYTYEKMEDGWRQRIKSHKEVYSLNVVNLNEQLGNIEKQMKSEIEKAQSSLNIQKGPIINILYFQHSDLNFCRLLITIHHLVVDSVSWRIILEDLFTFYRQDVKSEPIHLLNKTTTFSEWSTALRIYANEDKLWREREYWEQQQKVDFTLPVDFINYEDNVEKSKMNLSWALSSEETNALTKSVYETIGLKVHEVLIAALIMTLHKWSNAKQIKIDLEGHGREAIHSNINLTRTVGWFTSLYPFAVNITDSDDIVYNVQSIINKIRSIPNNGLGYGILKHINGAILNKGQSEVSFNYLGRLQSEWNDELPITLASEVVEPLRHPNAKRAYLLDVEGGVIDGQLTLNWMYSKKVHQENTILKQISTFSTIVKEIIAAASRLSTKRYVPKDFVPSVLTLEEWNIVNEFDRDIEDLYRLSPVQEGMLFHYLLASESGIYVQQIALNMKGNIAIEPFIQSWKHVIKHHPILRTSFRWEGLEKPIQIVERDIQATFEVLDWTNKQFTTNRLRDDELEKFRTSLREKVIDIKKDKLLHFTLIKLAEDEVYFIWNYHHILLDGWSMPIIFKQQVETYTNIMKGTVLPSIDTVPFRIFINWYMQKNHSLAKDFWKEMLEGYSPTTYLPNYREDDNKLIKGNKNAVHQELSKQISNESLQKLKQLAMKYKVTLNGIIQTAWAIFLRFISNKDDVIFGTVFSGRPASITGIDSMVGMFINTLPLRIIVKDDKNLLQLMKETYSLQMQVGQHEHTSLVDVKKWAGIQTKGELFDTCVIYANFPNVLSTKDNQHMIENLQITEIAALEQTNYPLTLSIITEDHLLLDINYDKSRFHKNTVENYLSILEYILTNFEQLLYENLNHINTNIHDYVKKRDETSKQKQKELNRKKLRRNNRKTRKY